MNFKDFLILLKESAISFCKNPIVAVPSVVLLVFLTLFSKVSVNINYSLVSSVAITSWLILFVLISLIGISYSFTGLISLSKSAIRKEKISPSNFLKSANKFFLKNLVIIIFVLAIYNVIRFASHYLALFIGKSLNLQTNLAVIIFFIFFTIGLLGILIFFTFSSFTLVIKNLSIKQSLFSSIKIVRQEYPATLSILLIFFVIGRILTSVLSVSFLVIDIINAIIIIPYFSLVLTNFVLKSK